jgi:hypothetical protein
MKKSDAFQGRFLKKEDGEPPFMAEIAKFQLETIVDNDTQVEEVVRVVYLRNPTTPFDTKRGIRLNDTNWNLIAGIRGEHPDETDTDKWPGTKVVIWNDMTVRGPKGMGGIRFRMPKDQPEAVEEQPPIGPTPDDVPF